MVGPATAALFRPTRPVNRQPLQALIVHSPRVTEDCHEGSKVRGRRCGVRALAGQDAEVFAGNVVDQRHGAPITIGYGRYGTNQSIDVTLEVDDVMIVLEGRLTVSTNDRTMTAGPGDIVHMPKGETVTIRSHEQGAVTAYVTYPHWLDPGG